MQDNSTAIYDGQVAWIRVIGGDGGWAAVNLSNEQSCEQTRRRNRLNRVFQGDLWEFFYLPASELLY